MKPSGKNLVGLQLYVCSGHIFLVCFLSTFLHVKLQVLVCSFFWSIKNWKYRTRKFWLAIKNVVISISGWVWKSVISLYTSQTYTTGFSISFLILNNSLEMRAAFLKIPCECYCRLEVLCFAVVVMWHSAVTTDWFLNNNKKLDCSISQSFYY